MSVPYNKKIRIFLQKYTLTRLNSYNELYQQKIYNLESFAMMLKKDKRSRKHPTNISTFELRGTKTVTVRKVHLGKHPYHITKATHNFNHYVHINKINWESMKPEPGGISEYLHRLPVVMLSMHHYPRLLGISKITHAQDIDSDFTLTKLELTENTVFWWEEQRCTVHLRLQI